MGPNWEALENRHPSALVKELHRLFETGPFELTAQQLAIRARENAKAGALLLDKLADLGFLEVRQYNVCACARAEQLENYEPSTEVCSNCGLAFGSDVQRPTKTTSYVHRAPRTRDVRWALALHGMNTRGPWQEEVNWLLSTTYARSVPVAIYKYGWVLSGAVLEFRLRKLTADLAQTIRALSGDAKSEGFGGRPDVIAHSLGTLLLSRALETYTDLKLGRVILTGCIIRPDFDWRVYLTKGHQGDESRVEAVLCHVATKDFWALAAHYVIPGSGPAGRYGFIDRAAVDHRILQGGEHGTFFEGAHLRQCYEQVWQPFLTRPVNATPTSDNGLPSPTWRQAPFLLRSFLMRYALLFTALALVSLLATALVLGLRDLWVYL
jgi:hypothetical protein